MPINAKNGARATLAAGITASSTSITLTTGHGARMPSVPFNAWVYNASDFSDDPHDDPNYEIVRVTARATDTLTTVVRGQEGTSASTHNIVGKSYRLVAGLSAGTIQSIPYADYYNAKMYGLAGDGVTDDTAALQILVDLVVTNGGGTIYFPPGVYIIGGPLQATSTVNAQIVLPFVADGTEIINLSFVGAIEPVSALWTAATTKPTGRAYSILKSTLTGATGTASMIGGTDGTNAYFNNLTVNFRNLTFETPPNPTFTVLNLLSCLQGDLSHLLIHPGSIDLNGLPQPTHTNSYGLKLPANNHSSRTKVDFVIITGFYTGILLGEATDMHASCWGCVQAMEVPFTHHASIISHFQVVWCGTGIIGSGSHPMIIHLLDFEHANNNGLPWQQGGADIYDPSNFLFGNGRWISISASVGNDHTLSRIGGANLKLTELGV